AELLAIDAVMGGCLPEYMPVPVPAVEAITDSDHKFDHKASLGSPWPMFIVNGPAGRDLRFSYFGHPLGWQGRRDEPSPDPAASACRALPEHVPWTPFSRASAARSEVGTWA